MHKNLRIFNAPNGIEFQSTSLRPSGTNRRVLFHLSLHITLRIITLLLTNYWGKLIRVPEHTKSIEYLHLNIQKGRGAKMHGKCMKTSKYWHSPSCHQCPSQDCMNRQLRVGPPIPPAPPANGPDHTYLILCYFCGKYILCNSYLRHKNRIRQNVARFPKNQAGHSLLPYSMTWFHLDSITCCIPFQG